MKHLKRKDGFALVELVVGIAAAALVLAAASSLLLMGARIQRTLRDEAQEQQTIRIVLTMLEDLVAEGKIKSIEPIVETNTDGWQLKGETEPALLTFSNQTLYAGGSVLLENVSATANLNGNLLNFTFTTDRGTYETSTYCRTVVVKDKQKNEDISKEEGVYNPDNIEGKDESFKNEHLPENEAKDARYAFLQTLCAEYDSKGEIKNSIDGQSYQYYSEWYIEGYKNGWSSSTPWCACFLSWAAAKNAASLSSVPKFANVNTGVSKFKDGTYGTWKEPSYIPIPGDYIFFDWERDGDPDHVGAVLFVDNNTTVYTIEGNSGGRVAIHSYNIRDPRIYGYGVLNWAS